MSEPPSSLLRFEGNGYPVIKPLQTLHDLLSWRPSPEQHICQATIQRPLSKNNNPTTTTRPKLLACHDMAGNYGEDRLIQGAGDAAAYVFTAWPLIDVFVYFSHSFITVPPPSWINAGHKHGVPVLGTFITEWETGAEKCKAMFQSPQRADQIATQLTLIAKFIGVDGWLINIENEVPVEYIPNLVHFLRVLTYSMHQTVPGSQVIWYDAVTVQGKLEWQNTLNELNRPFLDACDALFVNYTWKETTPEQVFAAAGDRKHDVYMGIDCFGRGTYGGGGMDCDIAIKASLSHGLSSALFGIGWPFEHHIGATDCSYRPGQGTTCLPYQQTISNRVLETPSLSSLSLISKKDCHFWRKIAAALTKYGKDGLRSMITELPFATDFSLGKGVHYWLQGGMISNTPWYNMSLQSPQPLLMQLKNTSTIDDNNGSWKMDCSMSHAAVYSGGNSLCITCRGQAPHSFQKIPLFKSNALIPSTSSGNKNYNNRKGSGVLRVEVTFAEYGKVDFCIQLRLAITPHNNNSTTRYIDLNLENTTAVESNDDVVSISKRECTVREPFQVQYALFEAEQLLFRREDNNTTKQQEGVSSSSEVVVLPPNPPMHWITECFDVTCEELKIINDVEEKDVRLQEVNIVVKSWKKGYNQLYLGKLAMFDLQPPETVQQHANNLCLEHVTWETQPSVGGPVTVLSCTLKWTVVDNASRNNNTCYHCHIWQNQHTDGDDTTEPPPTASTKNEDREYYYLGAAATNEFIVAMLPIHQGTKSVTFTVVCVDEGLLVPEPMSCAARVTVNVPLVG